MIVLQHAEFFICQIKKNPWIWINMLYLEGIIDGGRPKSSKLFPSYKSKHQQNDLFHKVMELVLSLDKRRNHI